MAQTRPSPTLSRGFTRLGRFLAPYATGHEAAGGDREATPRWRVWLCARASGIQPSGMPPRRGPGRARVRRRRPAHGAACAAIAGRVVPVARAPLRGAASYEAEG